jgi:hypothetical protein
MSSQTKIITESEKQLVELERLYHSVESRIGLAVLNAFDALETVSEQSVTDAETFLKLQKEKDAYNKTAQELRDRAAHQKECAASLAKIKRIRKTAAARRDETLGALGYALCEHYTADFELFFAAQYESVCVLCGQIAQNEQTISENGAANSAGVFETIKTTLDKTAKKAALGAVKQKLNKTYSDAGAAAFNSGELKKLFADGKLERLAKTAYKDALAAQEEIDKLREQEEEITTEMEQDANFIKDLDLEFAAGSAEAKIRALEKKINKASIAERIILSRVGKRYIESTSKKRTSGAKSKKQGKETVQEAGAFRSDIASLMERARILQSDIAACKKKRVLAERDIAIEQTVKSITLLKNHIAASEKKAAKLATEKNRAEEKLAALSSKLSLLRSEQ